MGMSTMCVRGMMLGYSINVHNIVVVTIVNEYNLYIIYTASHNTIIYAFMRVTVLSVSTTLYAFCNL